jgi:hypothetical protein
MNSPQNNTIVHVEELLIVFNDIDSRIRELHENSSQVFLQLNDFLKDYYKKNSIISTNATQIFDTISGNKESCLTCELNVIFNELENYKEGTDNELDTNMSLYNNLDNKINYLSLLMRNFKQDLLTLEFLMTNYKIISNNEGFDTGFLESLEKWENTIKNIHPWLTDIGKEIGNLSANLGKLNNSTRSYSQNSVNKNFSLYEELKSAITLVNKKNLESKNYIPILKEKLDSSSESIGNIITHIQYHDIIRQKIEHIQQSHFKIIASLKEDIGTSGRKLINEDDKIIQVIADISGLQAAQLILISKEYQKALGVISNNFQKIADDLTTVSTISHEFSYETNNSETTLINIVKGRLDRSLLLLDGYNSNSFNQELLVLKQQISEISKNIIHRIIEPLEKSESCIIFLEGSEQNKRNNLENKPSIVVQIATLTSDITEKKDDLKKELSNVLKLSERFLVENDFSGFRSNLEKEQIRIMVGISKTLDRLDAESKQLDSVLLQNCCIKKDIINRLKETLNQADYYELFEKILNVIIEQLNAMNNRLKIDGNGINKSEKIKNLKEIESYYTVASERIIHQKVINEDKEIIMPENSKDEEDLELF